MKPIVYFTKEITPESVLRLFKKLNVHLPSPIAFKVHSGEKGNQNFLHPEFWKEMINEYNGIVVECNTAYEGERNDTKKHRRLIKEHGWEKYYPVDIMDEDDNDIVLDIPNGRIIKKNYVGRHLENYKSMIVLSHFKGHPMGGYGGALKQLSIGVASSRGKAYIHSAGRTTDQNNLWNDLPEQDLFLEAMAEAASSVVKYFGKNMAFINVMKNISVDCDCCAIAEDPCMKDIGILASLDPIAIDQACIDLIYKQKDDPGQAHFLERLNSRHGIHTIERAYELGFGSREYQLINIDE